MDALRNASGFLGTGAPLLQDINLILQLVFYVALCLGIMAQRKRKYHWHDRFQTPVVVLNLLFIGLIMIPSARFVAQEIPARLKQTFYLVPTVHMVLGTLSEVLAIYCLLSGFKILPRKIGVLRYWMWTTFVLWTASVIFGVGIYFVWYGVADALGRVIVVAPKAAPVAETGPGQTSPPPEIVSEHSEEVVATSPIEQARPSTEEPTPTSPPAEVVSEHDEAPVEAPTNTPSASTASPPSLAATPTPVVFRPLEVGSLQFSDANARSDQVTLQLADIPPPPDNTVYQAWLLGSEAPTLNLGQLTVEGNAINHTFIDPEGRNLVGLYNRALITVEPSTDTDPGPAAEVIFSGEIPLPVMEHIRYILAASPETSDGPGTSPKGVGFALGALGQAALAQEHASFQQQAVNEANIPNLRFHAEHVINIIEGSNGPNFGDNDGNGLISNPGDGFGLLGDSGYLNQVVTQARLASQAEGASDRVSLHADLIEIAGANATTMLVLLRDAELKLRLEDTTGGAVGGLMADVVVGADRLINGQDANGDGQIDPRPGEGALQTMYAQAQLMAAIPIFTTEAVEAGQPQPSIAEPTPTPVLISPPTGAEHDEEN